MSVTSSPRCKQTASTRSPPTRASSSNVKVAPPGAAISSPAVMAISPERNGKQTVARAGAMSPRSMPSSFRYMFIARSVGQFR